MTVEPEAAGGAAAIMASLYIAILVEQRVSESLWRLRSRVLLAVGGLGMFLPAPVMVLDVVLLTGSFGVAGPWAWPVLAVNALAVTAQVSFLLAAWNEAERLTPRGPGP